ncbi:transcription termination/antitermination NusG family protein [Verrucomicrobiota bacterium]
MPCKSLVLRFTVNTYIFTIMSWYVLFLRPRSEKKLGQLCEIHGISCYLPLREETKVYQRRKVVVEKPIFPGYFFASVDREERVTLLKSNHVFRTLKPINESQLLHELAQIRKALSVDPTLGACAAFTKGSRVRIVGGPFMGIEGVIQSLQSKTKVKLNVEIIGRAVAVEVDQDLIDLME